MPTEQLTNWEWLPEDPLNESECSKAQLVLDMKYQTCYPMHRCAVGVQQCLRFCVSVCLSVGIEKCFKQCRWGVHRRHTTMNTISHWDIFLFLVISAIIISWLHVVVSIIMTLLNIVSNSTTWKYRCSKWRGAQRKYSMNTFLLHDSFHDSQLHAMHMQWSLHTGESI